LIVITLWDTGVSNLLAMNTSAFTAGASWLHVLASWNTNFTVGNKLHHLYVNNVSDKVVSVDSAGAGGTRVDATNWATGARTDGTLKLDGCAAEIYFAIDQFLDFSDAANRAKFILNGKPVDLGAGGSLPTGTAPIVYFSVRPGDAATAFATNRGTGGNFSITGSLDLASTSPSD